MTSPADENDPVLQLTRATELVDIQITGMHVERLRPGAPTRVNPKLDGAIQIDEQQLTYIFKVDIELFVSDEESGTEEQKLADVGVRIATTFTVDESLAIESLSQDTVQDYGSRTAYRLAFPYIREGLQALAARIRMNGLVFGVLRPDQLLPVTVSLHAESSKFTANE